VGSFLSWPLPLDRVKRPEAYQRGCPATLREIAMLPIITLAAVSLIFAAELGWLMRA
jgi:hypothetical protein